MAADQESQLYKKPSLWWRIIILTGLLTVIAGLVSIYSISRLQSNVNQPVKPVKAIPAKVAITALGRIQPQGEVTKLSAPSSLSGVRVEKLLVKEGASVQQGQIIAWLEGYTRARTALQQATDKVQIAQVRLAQVQAGAKTGDINAQKATIARLESQLQGEAATQQAAIARLEAELANAQTENNRYQQLYEQGAIAATTADSKRLQQNTLQQQLNEARANLNSTLNSINQQITEAKAKLGSIKEVRPVDVKLAQAEVQSAITAVKQAKADYDLTYLKSSIDGKVLKVNTKTGEISSNQGVIEIGKTSQMIVVAEVYQTDINKVRLGQKATITSTAFPKKIQGTVSEIGLQVDRQNILSVNPTAETDRRVVEVKIRINNPTDSQQVSGLTNLQVDVAIQI
ncbi:ABC exporter membrane fusion protein [Iningainema tapete]|uniref:ABC exporter membrane fusion protein n=1 Tax=Iningainema tapete BLCC-T55 TaxID=2748662 RepID=A0A8J7BWD5_9CYAN|nr:ABC exporter membrane fusion protein [Iningainema tapete]MBD2770733.1 ABC exporter membrane fusion protein [Iningainema tapete BLCC-T55]